MTSSKRDPDCCWTCRLRRKKCDRARPVCGGCRNLSIACHRDAERPGWMDGGAKQRHMTESIKNQIRRNAEQQRERNAGAAGVNGGLNFIIEPRSAVDSHQFVPSTNHRVDMSIPSSRLVASAAGLSPTIYQTSSLLNDAAALEHFETAFLTKYLDDVFPFLFPFYRPSAMETGRSWVLALLKNSDVARHAALSLTAYFLAVFLKDTYPGEFEHCKKELWTRLGQQTDTYFKQIQEEVARCRFPIEVATVSDRARSMESIVQALIFEVVLGRSGSWSIHLTAALGLFDSIHRYQTQDDLDPTLLSLLKGLGEPAWYIPASDSYIWNTEQAGFRFFAALLIFLDVVGSTAAEQRPHLLDHYPLLLAESDGEGKHEPISLQLSGYIGCQNWVIVAIAETAALAKWKKDAKSNGSLSVMELTGRAMCIEEALDKGILALETSDFKSCSAQENKFRFGYWHSLPPVSSVTATNIWAHAARIYLVIVVSGWQPRNASIRAGVRKILALLQDIHSPSHLHTFTWPLVVSGCLAEPGEEQQYFRSILDNQSEMGMLGAMAQARDIIIQTWENQEALDRDNWDMASCFRIPGFPALLI